MLCNIALCDTVVCNTVLYCAVLCNTALCNTVLCNTVLYCTVLCNTVVFCTFLCVQDVVFPQLIAALSDQSSVGKQEVAVVALERLVQSLNMVSEPYLQYPVSAAPLCSLPRCAAMY